MAGKPWEKYAGAASAAEAPAPVEEPAAQEAATPAQPWLKYASPGEPVSTSAPAPLFAQPTLAPPETGPVQGDQPADMLRHVASGLGEAAFGMLELPKTAVDLLSAGAETLFGEGGRVENWPGLLGTTVRVSKWLGETGPGQAVRETYGDVREFLAGEYVDPAEHPFIDAMRTALEWGAGGVVKAGAKGAQKGLQILGKETAAESAEKLAGSVAPDVILGASAAGGSLADRAFGGEGGTGELLGGLVGLVGAIRTGNVSGITPQQQSVLRLIDEHAENADLAKETLRELVEEATRTNNPELLTGTLADLTGDKGLYDIESLARQINPKFDQQVVRETAKRENMLVDEFVNEISASPGAAADAGRAATNIQEARLDRIRQAMKTRIGASDAEIEEAVSRIDRRITDVEARRSRASAAAAQRQAGVSQASARKANELSGMQRAADQIKEGAERRAATERTGLKVEGKRAARSQAFYKAWDDARQDFNSRYVKPLYDLFEKGSPVGTSPLKRGVVETLAKLSEEEIKALMAKYGNEIDGLMNLPPSADPRDVQLFMSRMKDAKRNAKETNSTGVEEVFLGRVLGAVDEILEQTNPAYAVANAAYRSMMQRFETGPVGEAYAKARARNRPETFAQNAFKTFEEGALVSREIAQTSVREIREQASEYIRARAVDEGVDQKFMRKYDEYLDNFPELKRQLQRVADANDVEAQALKEYEQRSKQIARDATLNEKEKAAEMVKLDARKRKLDDRLKKIRADQRKQREKYRAARDKREADLRAAEARVTKQAENDAIGQYVRNPRMVEGLIDKPQGVAVLSKLYRRLSREPGGGEGFKAQVRQALVNKYVTTRPDPSLPTGEAQAFRDTAFQNLRNVLPVLQDARLITEQQAGRMYKTVAKTASRDARKKAIAEFNDKPDTPANKLIPSILSAVSLQAAPVNSLLLGGALRRTFKDMLDQNLTAKELSAIEDYMMSPEKYLDAIEDADTINDMVNGIITRINAVAAATSE